MKRSHQCSDLNISNLGQSVRLIGWIHSIRDHGGLLFIDLRDRSGLVQLVFSEDKAHLRPESVIEVEGKVSARPAETINKRLATGEIEVLVKKVTVHNLADPLPFPLDDEQAEKVNEELRLTYRYLELRRTKLQRLLQLRHRVMQSTRNYLNAKDFWEIDLPLLFKTTPEGAREFLVPSRLNPGSFYALAQSPQQYKQMLMVGAIERYYSIAKCFRDEDLRADRQPEFTQIDLEMSFIEREDMQDLIEGMLGQIWHDILGIDLPTFPRMTYFEAMGRYGTDKPDTRFGLELKDVSTIFTRSNFQVFRSVVDRKESIIALKVPHLGRLLTQGEMNGLETEAKSLGAKGLAYIRLDEAGWKSPILKFLSDEEKNQLQRLLDLQSGDAVFFAASGWENACTILGRIRLCCANLLQEKGLLKIPESYNFLWVVDFPLLTFDREENRYVATHHPFTAPVEDDIPLLDSHPEKVRGQHYDIVLNGWELGGGSIRIHSPELQRKIFHDILRIPEDVMESRFGYFLRAFHYGAPPHGGIALGLDRLVSLMGHCSSIRDVIAFPKTQKGMDLMSQSPSPAGAKQLRDLHIAIREE